MSAEQIVVLPDEEERRRIQREKNQAAIDLLNEWRTEEGDPHNDAEVWEQLKAALNEGRPEGRKLFHD